MTFNASSLARSVRRRTTEWSRRVATRFGLEDATPLEQWRGQILAAILGGTLILGLPPLALAIWFFAKNGIWPMIVVDVLAYLTIAGALYSRRLKYTVRAWTVIGALFAIGSLALTFAGFRTAGAVWLIVASICACLLITLRAGVLVVLANVVVFFVLGVAIANDLMPWAIGVPMSLPLWIMSTANTTMLSLMTTVSVGVLLNGIEREAAARVRAEEERRRGQALEAFGALAGGIAHDFNNLLAPILANAELLGPRVSTDNRERVDDIRTSAMRGRDLVRRLLMLRNGEVMTCATAEMSAVVRETARLVRSRAASGVSIDVRVSTAPTVRASEAELHQIVMNLATNAVQAMPDGGTLLFEVDGDEADGTPVARLRVRDTGVGMSEQTRARAFDPFFTTKAAQEGTGLGLATVRTLVTALGGTVAIESTIGRGTLVTVTLPGAVESRESAAPRVDRAVRSLVHESRDTATTLAGAFQLQTTQLAAVRGASAKAPAESARTLEREALADAARRHRFTILLVDDEPGVLEVSRRVVNALGHEAIAFPSAAAAEAWFNEHPDTCDLIITDHRMPERTGPQLIAALRRHRAGLPAVVVSGFAAEASHEVRSLGEEVAILQKPFGMAELKAVIDEQVSTLAATIAPG